MKNFNEIEDVYVHGCGVEGAAAVRYFSTLQSNKQIIIIDGQVDHIPDELRRIVTGVITEDDFAKQIAQLNLDHLLYLRSPGIKPDNRALSALYAWGGRSITPTGYWLKNQSSNQVITVTGSKGKSTTAHIINSLIEWSGHSSRLVGNIGAPPLSEETITADYYVAELSSFQLYDFDATPSLHVITNIFNEHTDWHGSFDEYVKSKLQPLLRHEQTECLIDLATLDIAKRHCTADYVIQENYVIHSQPTPKQRLIQIMGLNETLDVSALNQHFASEILTKNLCTAIAATLHKKLWTPRQCFLVVKEHLHSWTPLPHRKEVLVTNDGRIWIDDSLATIPEATLSVMAEWSDRNIFLIVGGKDRGQDWKRFVFEVSNSKNVTPIIFGEISTKIHDAAMTISKTEQFVFKDGLPDAIAFASMRAQVGDAIIFSPGAASSSPYKSYRERSQFFRECALKETM